MDMATSGSLDGACGTRTWRDPLRWLLAPWTLLVFFPLVALTTAFWGLVTMAVALASPRAAFHSGVAWARGLCWTSFVGVRVEGRAHAEPGRSYVIMANHQGNYDILALYGFLGRQFRWVMKQELRKVPFLGPACAAIGHVFEGSRQGDERFKQILEGHIRDGVCDEQGNLLLVWSGGPWVKPAWSVLANHGRRSS